MKIKNQASKQINDTFYTKFSVLKKHHEIIGTVADDNIVTITSSTIPDNAVSLTTINEHYKRYKTCCTIIINYPKLCIDTY